MRKWFRDISTGVTANLIWWVLGVIASVVAPSIIPWVRHLPVLPKIGILACSGAVFIVCALLIVRYRTGRRGHGSEPFAGAADEVVRNLSRLAEEQQRDHMFEDSRHHFHEIKATYEVNDLDGFYSVSYVLRNMSSKASRSMICLVSGDSAVDKGLLDIRVTCVRTTDALRWEFIEEQETPFRKPLCVYFPRPLEHDQKFALKVSCRWPGTFARKQDYVFFPIPRFRRGIRLLRLQVIMHVRPVHYEGVVWSHGRYSLAETQPRLRKTPAGWALQVALHSPNRAYAIWFTRPDV